MKIKSGLYTTEELKMCYIGYTGNGFYELTTKNIKSILMDTSATALFLLCYDYVFIGEV